MIIRFKIPIHAFLWGPTPDSLEFQSTFAHNGFTCSLRLQPPESLRADSMPPTHQYYGKVDYLEFTVSENAPEKSFKQLIDTRNYNRINQLLRSIANRCVRSIRNFGRAPHLHELPKDESQDPKKELFQLRAECREETEEWKPLVPIPKDGGLLFFALMESQVDTSTNLEVSRLPEIEEAIQDNLVPLPEDEFRTNTIEHLRSKNLRMALLESVIGLEIVLTRYLKEYLRVHKKTPKTRIAKFLAPQVGLTSRLAGTLDLTLSQGDLKSVDLEKILKAVEWRNSITHKTGHLPSGLPEKTVEDGISEIIALTGLLAMRANQVSASPAVQEISKYLYEKHQIPAPIVWILPSHRVFAEFTIFTSPIHEFPDINKLNAVVADFIIKRGQQDARFKPKEHLFVNFYQFPQQLRARWRKGELEPIQG